jgi:hypothetical protein
MINCRFKLVISNGIWKNSFLCGADSKGYAFSFNGSDMSNPCIGCKKYVEGDVTHVDYWLKSNEFWEISGKLIRKEDWEYWNENKN